MHINWKSIAHLAAAMVGSVVPGVAAAEQAAEAIASATGASKQQDVLDTVNQSVLALDSIAGREIIKSDAAQAATRAVIDAVVNLHNVVAAAVAPAPASKV